jgi:hypothetical protein
MLNSLEQNQTVIVNQFHSSTKDKIGGYRFLNNKRISQDMLVKSLQLQCKQNTKDSHVICLQDTSEYNFEHHSNRLKKDTLGVVGNNEDHGFLAHLMVCFDAQSTLPLGISFCKQWSRDPNRKDNSERKYQSLPIEEKESFKWIEAANETKDLLGESKHITFISDRESDIYQIWSRIPDQRTDLIIRARVDRNLFNNQSTVFKTLEELEVSDSYYIDVHADKRKKRTGRIAKLNLKFTEVLIKKPKLVRYRHTNDPDFLSIYAIQAKEDSSTIPTGETPIQWILFTTYKIEDSQTAMQIIQWYCFRWQIEQFFRITKHQGLDSESSQLETGEGLMKIVLMGFAIALKILQLSLAREGIHNDTVEKYFEPEEVEVLEILNKNLQGKTEKQINPFPVQTLSWASWVIARLGGYSGYKSQSPPGPITYKWGLDKFAQIKEGFRLAKDVYKE